MSEATKLELAEAGFDDSTYPESTRLATDLYEKIKEKLAASGEPVDFGKTALDIGSKDGRYASVIRQLGPTTITAIDPSVKELQKGIDHGFLNKNEVFKGTLEKYVKQATSQVDSAFVFNVNPDLARNEEFIDALLLVVKPGGIVVVSFVERETAVRFIYRTFRNKKIDSIREKSGLKTKDILEVTNHRARVNGFLAIGRRTEK